MGNGIPIFGYGLMLMLGFLATLVLGCWRARKYGLTRDAVIDVGIIAILAGVIGARLAFLFLDYTPSDGKIGTLAEWVAVWEGGLTFQGGLILALAAAYGYLRWKGISVGRMFDAYAPGLAIGVGFGRLGCLMNGCCWGKPAPHGSPFGMRFPNHMEAMAEQIVHYTRQPDVWAGLMEMLGYPAETTPTVPIYATQSISAVGLFLLGIGLMGMEKWVHRRVAGQVVLWFVLAYSVGRFFIEFWRDDTPLRYGIGGFEGLKLGQWFAVGMFAAALVVRWYLGKKGRVEDFG